MMKKFLTLAAVGLFGVAAPAALANESQNSCEAYVAEHGGDASGCACLGEAAAADPVLAEKLAAITKPEDLDAADEDTRKAIGACFPEDDAEEA